MRLLSSCYRQGVTRYYRNGAIHQNFKLPFVQSLAVPTEQFGEPLQFYICRGHPQYHTSSNSVSQVPITTFARKFTTQKDKDETNTTTGGGVTTTTLEDKNVDHGIEDDESSLIVSQFKNQMVHQLWTERAKAKKEKGSKKTTATSNKNGKTPRDSEIRVEYPFQTNPLLAESYKSPWNTMRLGKLFEDLDALAGNIAFYHVRQEGEDSENHPLIVTASVDRIRLRHPSPLMPTDQTLSGRVTYVGTSSMEIRMHCASTSEKEPWLEAFFTFVTLDPHTKKPMHITPLLPETPQEQADFQVGEQRAALKKARRKQQQQHATKAGGEDSTVDQTAQGLLQQARPLLLLPHMPTSNTTMNCIQMSETQMQNALIAQPQSRNLHNRIFGGFLMRRAFELAFANAHVFGGARPVFKEVDEVSFHAPVDVGDLLVFNSRVLYTSSNTQHQQDNHNNNEYPLVHLEVEAWVTVPEEADVKLSNQFYFTFAIVGNNDEGAPPSEPTPPLRQILPANIDEATRMARRMEADRDQAQHDT